MLDFGQGLFVYNSEEFYCFCRTELVFFHFISSFLFVLDHFRQTAIKCLILVSNLRNETKDKNVLS